MDTFQLVKRNNALPPIKLVLSSKRKNQEPLSSKLQLYIKFRTASNITINSPIESLVPSNMSRRNSSFNPTQNHIVAGSQAPAFSPQNMELYKYSRLFEASQRIDATLLQNSVRTQEQPNPLSYGKKLKNVTGAKKRKPLKTMKRENLRKKSIPFLSDIFNKVCQQESDITFSAIGPLESQELLVDVDRERQLSEIKSREIEENAEKCLHTEGECFKGKRRVIFYRNPSFMRKGFNNLGGNGSENSDGY